MPCRHWLLLPLCGCAAAADAWILRPEQPWSFSWEERRLANEDGASLSGFSRLALPVRHGWWGELAASASGSTRGEARHLPFVPPASKYESATLQADLWAAWGPLFAHAQPSASIATRERPLTHPDPRAVWTGSSPTSEHGPLDERVAGTLGISGFGHVLALSNEPFRWGEGIFGGVVMGGGWRGFPHAVLATRGPQSPAPAGSWLEPLALGYEFVVGRMDAEMPAGDGVRFAGFRMALRWDAVTLSWTKALLFDGDREPRLPRSHAARTLLRWRSGNDGPPRPGEPDPNRFAALGLRLDWPRTVAWSIEYGIDDQNPFVPGQWLDTTLTQEARWTSAIWTMTVDWLDVADDGDWRLALEWYRAESYAYGHGRYPWYLGDSPLAHPDGGNSTSLRLLVQVQGDDADRWTLVASWRRHGLRNAESGNPNTARKDPGVPGSGTYAPRPWDRLGLDLRYDQELSERWAWWAEAGAAWHANRDFRDNEQRLDGLLSLGAARRW